MNQKFGVHSVKTSCLPRFGLTLLTSSNVKPLEYSEVGGVFALSCVTAFLVNIVWILSDGARETSTILLAILFGSMVEWFECCPLLASPSLRSRPHAFRLVREKSRYSIVDFYLFNLVVSRDDSRLSAISESSDSTNSSYSCWLSSVQPGMYSFQKPRGICFLAIASTISTKRW